MTKKNISGISEKKDTVQKTTLYGKRIAISVSGSEELEQLGLSENHIKDATIEIARYLLVNGATMLYGGDLRHNGFTALFSELSYQYKYLSDREARFVNYFPFPNSRFLTDNDLADFLKKQVEARILPVPKHLGDPDPRKDYKPLENVEDRFLYSECYADMRIQMAKESNARIVLGGRQKGYTGYFPGIVEETFHALNAGNAVYLLGGFGGATKSIIDIISGSIPPQMTNEFQFDTAFLNDFRKYASDKFPVPLDYTFLVDFFKKYKVETLSEQNGLTVEENQILFDSINIHELVFLIIKGLKNISNKK
ncbi:MAG: hypothetical protein M0R16_12130 [Bacteroidales bacterium]|nr:hypothetical protein [Bacteroidales bacterium]